MIFGLAVNSTLAKSALIAYVHYLSFVLCFGALLYERIRIKPDPNRSESIGILVADIIYGVSGIALLLSGILRVRFYGQGADFYTHNPLFWIKVGLFIAVGLLSLYPTITYVLWAIPLSKGQLPEFSNNIVSRFKLILNIELFGFASIPLLATFMARGIGLS